MTVGQDKQSANHGLLLRKVSLLNYLIAGCVSALMPALIACCESGINGHYWRNAVLAKFIDGSCAECSRLDLVVRVFTTAAHSSSALFVYIVTSVAAFVTFLPCLKYPIARWIALLGFSFLGINIYLMFP